MNALHTWFSYTISINVQQPCTSEKKSVYPLIVPVLILYLQPRLHLFNNLVITYKLSPRMASLRAGEMEIWGSSICAVRWVGKNSSSEFYDCFPCFQTCVWSCVVVMEDFQQHFVGWISPGTPLQGFKSLNIQIWVVLTTWHNVCQNHPLCFSSKQLPERRASELRLAFLRTRN
jgi:hypothetical protein